MGPALQRLLARPSSLEFLRLLVGTPAANTPDKRTRSFQRGRAVGRRHASIAAVSREVEGWDVEDVEERPDSTHRRIAPAINNAQQGLRPIATIALPPKNSIGAGYLARKPNQPWDEALFTHEQLEFESNLDTVPAGGRIRLLDSNEYRKDLRLWACLLQFRKRIHGSSGVITFWKALQRRNFHLPTRAPLAEKFWPEFLAVGFQDHTILEEICAYADKILYETGQKWSPLYVRIIQHFLLSRQGMQAIRWHDRLSKLHHAGANHFGLMCREVTFLGGDMEALRSIYLSNPYRNAYSKIIPALCQREDFKSALSWHFLLLSYGDLPPSSKTVEALVHFLALYDRPNALRVTKSLVDAGVSFASSISDELRDNTKISREMMNLVHGKTFHVSVKKYNDSLGARWFATRWISLDVAINAIHALGVQEIGPLSLQAIALRDPDSKEVVIRINQLRDLGISLGDSLFSRAVENFAKNRRYDLLDSLLASDQHPDALEDGALQESLLASYAEAKDWTQYRRTLAIQSLVSKSPEIEKSNIILRYHVTRHDKTAIMEMLADMQLAGIPVTSKSIAHVIRYLLRPRQAGRRPITQGSMWNKGPWNDVKMVIAILKRIMRSGSYVPILHWREIIRRTGMLHRFEDLRSLCGELASWYGPVNPSSTWPPRRFRLPVQVPASHHLHPLRMLFNASLQKAIVEWGFIAHLRDPGLDQDMIRQGTVPSIRSDTLPDITAGVTLLKQLNQHGVYIDGKAVRSALFNRLVTYYGAGTSSRRNNRYGKARLRGKMALVAKQIDGALGGEYFTAVDLPKIIHARAAVRIGKVSRRWNKRVGAERGSYPVPRLRSGGSS